MDGRVQEIGENMSRKKDPRYIVSAVKGTELNGDGPRMCIQEGLFEAFAELYGGHVCDGRYLHMIELSCPEGDIKEARRRVLDKAGIYTVGGRSGAIRMRDAIIAAAREDDNMDCMGIGPLLSVLDRLGTRYDMFDPGDLS